MSKFGAMKAERVARTPAIVPAISHPPVEAVSPSGAPARLSPRDGKKAVSAYFSPAVSQGLNILAREQGMTLQQLMGEAFDDLMRKYGKHPFGER